MSASATDVHQQEDLDLLNKFKELMQQSKYLVTVVDSLQQENGQLVNFINNLKKDNDRLNRDNEQITRDNEQITRDNEQITRDNKQLKDEINILQNRSKELIFKLEEQSHSETSSSGQSARYAVDYLLKRNKAGIRPSKLNDTMDGHKPTVCLVSSLPKSGTWANQYFWSVFDSLCNDSESYDPYDAFFMKMEGLGVDVFGVSHFYCPGYMDYVSGEIKEKLEKVKYPSAHNFNWGTRYMKDVEIDKSCDPWLNNNVKIAFVYRNPLDQVISYSRVLWDPKFKNKKSIDIHNENGSITKIYKLKEYIRAGAASYVHYFLTFHVMKDILGDRLIFMRYEDMVRDRYEKHREMAEFFIGPDINTTYKEQLGKAEQITRIENMKLLEKASDRTLMHNYKAPMKGIGGYHVHNGSIGQWMKVLDQDDIDYIFKLLDDFGISKDYFVFE